jgi:hypothetical protein
VSLLLFDTDLFILMAGAGLLEETAHAVGFSLDNVRRLQPLPHMLRGSRLKSKYPSGLRERAAAWCDTIRAIETAPDVEIQERLTGLADLDVGEALLFASAAMTGGSVVATGDKRACRALATADLGTSRELLCGKVL